MSNNSLRGAYKATPLKKLKKQIDADDSQIGSGNEYIQLKDGQQVKLRLFPAHPGEENFYVAKKSWWLSFNQNDDTTKRGTVLDSIVHGGTKMDVCNEYLRYAQAFCADKPKKLSLINADKNGLAPSYSWVCYASYVEEDVELHAMLWEIKKTIRDQINRLAMSEDDDDPIEIDPFTDPDEGIPVFVKYLKNPNRKKGENYYDVSLGKKPKALPISDEALEEFSKKTPLSKLYSYGLEEFERALEGLQNFDEENEIGVFEQDDFLEKVEEIREQYTEETKEPKKKVVVVGKKQTKKVEVDDEDDVDEDEDGGVAEDGDEFDSMDRSELKKYIASEELEVTVFKKMSDDDIRDAIREAISKDKYTGDDESGEEEEDEDEKPSKSSLTVDQIRKKLKGGK